METCTAGGLMGGYCAIGRERSAIPPVRAMTIDSTDAKIGRSMKKREIMADTLSGLGLGGPLRCRSAGSRRRRFPPGRLAERRHGRPLRLDLHARAHLLQPAD